MHASLRALIPATLIALAASADAKLATSREPSVGFTAVGPRGLKINGHSTSLQVEGDDKNITITVPLSALDTGIGLRNSHMKDKYLEVSKYPNAVLVVPKISVGYPNASASKATGTLTLHGVTKPTAFNYDVRKDGADYTVSGSLRVNLADFKIEQPSFAGMKVDPDIDVKVSFRARD